jgi:hypothetical protein
MVRIPSPAPNFLKEISVLREGRRKAAFVVPGLVSTWCPPRRGSPHPQGFGRFGSETPTLDCVCDDCNAYFGRELDQLLTRDTYEGISRYSRGLLSSEARPQKRLSLTLAEPAEAGDFVGLRVAVDGTT